jgi:hypothetical protein
MAGVLDYPRVPVHRRHLHSSSLSSHPPMLGQTVLFSNSCFLRPQVLVPGHPVLSLFFQEIISPIITP